MFFTQDISGDVVKYPLVDNSLKVFSSDIRRVNEAILRRGECTNAFGKSKQIANNFNRF